LQMVPAFGPAPDEERRLRHRDFAMVAARINHFQKYLAKRGGICRFVSRHEGNLTTRGCGNRQAESGGHSDIPPLTDEQLSQFRRAPKVLIAARTATFTTGSSGMERAILPASTISSAL
jgi:hypothetical protein